MPQDFSPDQLADRVRDEYRDTHGTDSQIHSSAAWDAAFVNLALMQVRIARESLQDLVRTGDLPVTQSLGTLKGDSLPALETAEKEMERVLTGLRQL